MIGSHLIWKHVVGSFAVILYREGGHYRLEVEKNHHRISYAIPGSLRGNIGDVLAHFFLILDREYANPVQEIKRQLMLDMSMINLRVEHREVPSPLPEEYWDQL